MSDTHRGILIPSTRSAADMTVARAFVLQKVFTFVAARLQCAHLKMKLTLRSPPKPYGPLSGDCAQYLTPAARLIG